MPTLKAVLAKNFLWCEFDTRRSNLYCITVRPAKVVFSKYCDPMVVQCLTDYYKGSQVMSGNMYFDAFVFLTANLLYLRRRKRKWLWCLKYLYRLEWESLIQCICFRSMHMSILWRVHNICILFTWEGYHHSLLSNYVERIVSVPTAQSERWERR